MTNIRIYRKSDQTLDELPVSEVETLIGKERQIFLRKESQILMEKREDDKSL